MTYGQREYNIVILFASKGAADTDDAMNYGALVPIWTLRVKRRPHRIVYLSFLWLIPSNDEYLRSTIRITIIIITQVLIYMRWCDELRVVLRNMAGENIIRRFIAFVIPKVTSCTDYSRNLPIWFVIGELWRWLTEIESFWRISCLHREWP